MISGSLHVACCQILTNSFTCYTRIFLLLANSRRASGVGQVCAWGVGGSNVDCRRMTPWLCVLCWFCSFVCLVLFLLDALYLDSSTDVYVLSLKTREGERHLNLRLAQVGENNRSLSLVVISRSRCCHWRFVAVLCLASGVLHLTST